MKPRSGAPRTLTKRSWRALGNASFSLDVAYLLFILAAVCVGVATFLFKACQS